MGQKTSIKGLENRQKLFNQTCIISLTEKQPSFQYTQINFEISTRLLQISKTFKMHFSALTILFATTVLGVPTKSPLEARSWTISKADLHTSNDQGDGFYLATFNESNIAEVKFTPFATDLTARDPIEGLTTRSTVNLAKRGTECSGRYSGDLPTLDAANRELANNANGKNYNKGAWGWVSTSSLGKWYEKSD